MNVFRISRQIPEKSDVCRFSIKFAKTISKFLKFVKFVKIIQFYSILFNRVLTVEDIMSAGVTWVTLGERADTLPVPRDLGDTDSRERG